MKLTEWTANAVVPHDSLEAEALRWGSIMNQSHRY